MWIQAKRGQARAALPFELAARGAIARAAGDHGRLEVQLAHALGYAWLALSETTARAHLAEALALAIRVHGAGSAEAGHIQVELATALHDGGKFAEAAALYRQAEAVLTEIYGPRHPDVADALAFRGSSETSLMRLDEARATLERALAIYSALDGPESHRALRVVGEIGLVLTQDERFADAVVYLRRALAGEVRALGERDKLTALWRVNLAAALIPAGQLADARAELEQALATLAATSGPDHLFRGMALTFLAWTALEEGKPAEAEARGRPAEAIPLLEKNLVILRAAEGDDGLNATGAHRQLGTALLAAGRAAEALPHLEHVVAIRKLKGHDERERAIAERLLAEARARVAPL